MPKRGRRRQVDRSRWRQFLAVADNFAQGAEIAKEFDYWNAAGVLIVHAAIALTDALTVKVGGVKGTGEDHLLAASLLEEVLAVDSEGQRAIRHLRSILEEKHLVAYSGQVYRQGDIRRMSRHLERYSQWARGVLAG